MENCDRRNASGFTLISVLILVAVLSMAATASLKLGAIAQRRTAEQALLEVGLEFQHAFTSYVVHTPIGKPIYPNSIGDLLRDPRTPALRRHLRKSYSDPISGRFDWELLPAPGGQGFTGVHSQSQAAPIKRSSFDSELIGFDNSKSYQQWHFSTSAPVVVTEGGRRR